MRIITQVQADNKNFLAQKLHEGRKKHFQNVDAVHQAAVMAGEFIAAKNQKESTKIEDVINAYNPKYLERRS